MPRIGAVIVAFRTPWCDPLRFGALLRGDFVSSRRCPHTSSPENVTGVPAGYEIEYAYNGDSIALVPEPSTIALLLGLGLSLAALRFRR